MVEERKELENRCSTLERRNQMLEDEARRMRDENERLREELRFLRTEVRGTLAGWSVWSWMERVCVEGGCRCCALLHNGRVACTWGAHCCWCGLYAACMLPVCCLYAACPG